MIVLDASAVLSALFSAGPARTALSTDQVHVLHLTDSEVVNAIRRQVASMVLTPEQGWAGLDAWLRLGVTRHPVHPLLERVWALRDSVSGYDAGYLALSEALGCALLTADARLSRAPGIRCPITVVPR